jgi:integrase/recombinase XerD
MPPPNDVGESISNYVTHYRPEVNSSHVFLSTRAPFQLLNNPSTVSTIVRRQLAVAGIETTSKGAHLLRYTVATNCIRNHGSLYEACELLRHFSIDTTATYSKVDFERLSELAMA